MKQAVVTIKYDEEKLNAVKQYMGKKDADFDAEMRETLGKMYEKYVPQAVREYIEKPTDIWTNHPDPKFLPMCHNGDSCHVAAPRGSKTGTQGLKGARERSVIPQKLCDHIVDICEE